MFSPKTIMFFAFFVLLFSGCVSKKYVFTPPASDTGLQCVMQCQSTKTRCRDIETKNKSIEKQRCLQQADEDFYDCKEIAKVEYYECKKESDLDYIACLKHAKNRDKCKEKDCSKKKDKCYRSSCYNSPNFDSCDSNHRDCYRQCGGIVDVIEE